MNVLKYIVIICIALLILWIDLPENLNFKNRTINPLTIDLHTFGINFRKEFRTHLGLDLQGGSHLLFETDVAKINPKDIEEALNSAKDVIERRVNFFGVSEPTVQIITNVKQYRIAVDLPGISNTEEAIQLIGATAQLKFTEEQATTDANLATAPAILRLTKETTLTGKDVKKASVAFDPQSGSPQVNLEFTGEGAKKFADITSRNIGKPVGILLDKYIISAPTVQQAITDGNARISGNFSIDTAKQLAVAINSGALPIPIRLIEQRNIGATLGDFDVKRSVFAGLVGLLLVMLFMILYYRKFGVIACLALIIYGLISFAIFRAIPVVLTLSGVAGFLLSIGMAVDTNILIFERIKEELRRGRDFHIAIRLGFGRAIDAIKDANITTLIVAFILFNPLNWDFLPQFGLIRGFALTLAIGVGTSLFTGLFITRHLINFFYRKHL